MTTMIGDLVQSGQLRRSIGQTKAQIQTLTTEVTTGVASDIAQHLRGDLGALHSVRTALVRLDGYKTATTEMGLIAASAQQVVQGISAFATDLAEPLMSAGTYGQSSTIKAMGAEAAEKFKAAVAMLNTRVGDRAIFSGTATDRAPLPDGANLLQTLSAQVAGATTAAEVEAAVSGWFDDAAGYSATFAGSTEAMRAEIAVGEYAELSVTAGSDALRDTLKALALAAMLDDGALSLNSAEGARLASSAGSALIEGSTARADLTAELAVTEQRIAEAQTRNSAEASALEIAQAGLVEVDPYQASAQLSDAQTRLETIFAITARMSQLSLVNFLK